MSNYSVSFVGLPGADGDFIETRPPALYRKLGLRPRPRNLTGRSFFLFAETPSGRIRFPLRAPSGQQQRPRPVGDEGSRRGRRTVRPAGSATTDRVAAPPKRCLRQKQQSVCWRSAPIFARALVPPQILAKRKRRLCLGGACRANPASLPRSRR